MLILDTDYLTILSREDADARSLMARHVAAGEPVAPTAVSVEEVLRGWLGKFSGTRLAANQVRYYEKFQYSVHDLGRGRILPFDAAAAERFEQLRKLKLGIGTMDLKIAAIVLVIGATLLSRNLKDFSRVPRLAVEDWV